MGSGSLSGPPTTPRRRRPERNVLMRAESSPAARTGAFTAVVLAALGAGPAPHMRPTAVRAPAATGMIGRVSPPGTGAPGDLP